MNKIVKILILYDFFVVTAFGLLTPIFAIFVTNYIVGGNLLVVGIAEAIYLGTKAVGQIFVADYLDIEPSDKRNWRWAFVGSLVFSLAALLYIFCRYPFHLYLVELIMGVSSACEYPAFYALFLRHLDRRRRTFQLSFHNAAIEIGQAGAAAIGGALAYFFGFFNLFVIVAILSLFSTALLTNIYPIIKQMEKKERAESTKDFLPVVSSLSTSEDDLVKILPIRRYGESILREHAKPIKEIDDSLRLLAKNMLATMYRLNGAGLAANQVGVLKRIVVVDIGDGPLVLVNPKILKKSWQRETAEEGCLSLPGLVLKIRRPKNIEIEYFRIDDGKRIKLKASGLLARAILHEIEHLDGILIIDKLTFWQRARYKKQLAEIKETTQQLVKEREGAETIKRTKQTS
jgi:peptide deformylase